MLEGAPGSYRSIRVELTPEAQKPASRCPCLRPTRLQAEAVKHLPHFESACVRDGDEPRANSTPHSHLDVNASIRPNASMISDEQRNQGSRRPGQGPGHPHGLEISAAEAARVINKALSEIPKDNGRHPAEGT